MNKALLDILICPVSKSSDLHYDEERQEIICPASKLAYPVRDGIPVMLAEEARPLAPEETE